MKNLLLYIFLLMSANVCAQTADSLDSVVAKEQRIALLDSLYADFISFDVQERYDTAYTILKKVYELDPEAPEVNFQMGIYMQIFAPEDSTTDMKAYVREIVAKYEKAFNARPTNRSYANALVNIYMETQDTVNVRRMFERIVEINPRNAEYISMLMTIYSREGKYEEELKLLDKLENVTGVSPNTELARAEIYSNLYGSKKAVKYVEKLIKKQPRVSDYHLFLAQLYATDKKYSKALPEYDKALAIDSTDIKAQYSQICCLEAMGDMAKARQMKLNIVNTPKASSELKIQILRDLVGEFAAEGDTTSMAGIFLKALEQPQENTDMTYLFEGYLRGRGCSQDSIVGIMRGILAKEKTNEYAYRYLASYYAQQEKKEEVVDMCRQAISNGVNQLDLHYLQAVYSYQLDRYDDALDILNRAVAQRKFASNQKLYSDCYALIGDICHKRDSMTATYGAYEEALRWNADNIYVLNNYAYFLSLDGTQLDKAERMSRKTIEAEPKNGTYLDTYAWVLYRQGRYDEAVKYINRAIQDIGNVGYEVYEHAGDIYYKLNDKPAAQAYYELARDLAKDAQADYSGLEEKIKSTKK